VAAHVTSIVASLAFLTDPPFAPGERPGALP